jgi:hypothetical protein
VGVLFFFLFPTFDGSILHRVAKREPPSRRT